MQMNKYHVQLVSAEHVVQDDFVFPMGTCHFQAPTRENPLTDRSEILRN
jgi:hypothetical protein